MFGVAIGTMALIVVLSVFNGLEDLIRSLYSSFDPEIKIEVAEGKSFEFTDSLSAKIMRIGGIDLITEVIEDNVMLRYKDGTMVVKMKGVSDNWLKDGRMAERIVQGQFMLSDGEMPYAIVGRGIQYTLNISTRNDFYALQFFYPRNVRPGAMGLGGSNLYNQKILMPSGIFAIEKYYDENYVFVPISFARELTDYKNKITALEIKTKKEHSVKQVQEELRTLLGEQYNVLNTDEQHSSLLKAIQIEKLFVYITFSFILAVASFNIFFSLSMLAIEKQKDIAVLYALGAPKKLIRRIFIFEGSLISFSGAIVGMLIGFFICWLQQEFGLISMGMVSSVSEAYPVKMIGSDFAFSALSIVIITMLAAFRPASLAAKTDVKENI